MGGSPAHLTHSLARAAPQPPSSQAGWTAVGGRETRWLPPPPSAFSQFPLPPAPPPPAIPRPCRPPPRSRAAFFSRLTNAGRHIDEVQEGGGEREEEEGGQQRAPGKPPGPPRSPVPPHGPAPPRSRRSARRSGSGEGRLLPLALPLMPTEAEAASGAAPPCSPDRSRSSAPPSPVKRRGMNEEPPAGFTPLAPPRPSLPFPSPQ